MDTNTWANTGASGQGSLLRAAERLNLVVGAAPVLDPWYDELRDAIRHCLACVAHEIDVVEGPDGMHEAIASDEPRMIPYLQRLEASLHGLLGKLSEAESCGPRWHNDTVDSLSRVAAALHMAVCNENEIVHEAYVVVGTGD